MLEFFNAFKLFGFYVGIKRHEMRLRKHFCTLLAVRLLPKTIRYLSYVFRVNNIIYKYDQDNIVNWGKFHMSSKQICMCLTHKSGLYIFNLTTACLCL